MPTARCQGMMNIRSRPPVLPGAWTGRMIAVHPALTVPATLTLPGSAHPAGQRSPCRQRSPAGRGTATGVSCALSFSSVFELGLDLELAVGRPRKILHVRLIILQAKLELLGVIHLEVFDRHRGMAAQLSVDTDLG